MLQKIMAVCLCFHATVFSEILPNPSYIAYLDKFAYSSIGGARSYYAANFGTILLDAENSKFNELVYAFNRDSTIFEVNFLTGKLKVNGESFQGDRQALEDMFGKEMVLGSDGLIAEKFRRIFAEKFSLGLKNATHMNTYPFLEDKKNTCKAMLLLKEKYQTDPEMSFYLDLYLPETGFVESKAHLQALVTNRSRKGVVLKLDKGFSAANVFVIPPEDAGNLNTAESLMKQVIDNMQSVTSEEQLLDLIAEGKLIWQEFIDVKGNELGFLFHVDESAQVSLDIVTESLFDRHDYCGSIIRPYGISEKFQQIGAEAYDYFIRIARELVVTKINLTERGVLGLSDPDIRLGFFGFDVLPVESPGQWIPKISEVNPRLTGDFYIAHDALKAEKAAAGELFSWLCTGAIDVDPGLDAWTIIEQVKVAQKTVFGDAVPSTGRISFSAGGDYFRQYLVFPNLSESSLPDTRLKMQQYTALLQQRLGPNEKPVAKS